MSDLRKFQEQEAKFGLRIVPTGQLYTLLQHWQH